MFYFNSIYLIGLVVDVCGFYDKVRFVLFGEYVFLKFWMDWIGIFNFVGFGVGFVVGF